MDSINMKIEYFTNQIERIINEAQLPVGIVKLIIDNVHSQINQLYREQLQNEMTTKQIGEVEQDET